LITGTIIPMQDKKRYSVSIKYCSECNYREQAIRVSDELLSNYQHIIDQVVINTGNRGIFDVKVDDQLIFSKHELKRHANPGEILQLFKEIVGTDIPVYPK